MAFKIYVLLFNSTDANRLKKTGSYFILRSNSHYEQPINYDFCLNNHLFSCLLIVSKVVVKFN